MVDYRLPLMVQQPDILGSYVRGQRGAQEVRDMQRQRQLQDFLSERGGDVFRGDQNALQQLAGLDLQSALQTRGALEDRSMRQDLHSLRMDDATRAREREGLQRAVGIMEGITTPEEWDAQAQRYAPNLVGRFADKEYIIRDAIGLAGSLERSQAQTAGQLVGDYFGQPRNWRDIQAGIFAGESGGDYDALYGYSNREGGQFSDTKLTDMTVDQAIDFSAPSGEYGQWVKGQVGRVATPMGAYQVVGTTLRAAKDALGLTGNEVMTPELQDKIGQWIYRQQGTGAWEGYNPNVRAEPQQPSTQMGAALEILQNPNVDNTIKKLVLDRAGLVDTEQGFRMATPDEAAQYGSQAGQFGPDGRFYPITPPKGTKITVGADGEVSIVEGAGVGDAPIADKPKKDFERVLNEETGRYEDRVIRGSETWNELTDQAQKTKRALSSFSDKNEIVVEDIDRAIDLLEEGAFPATGLANMLTGAVPGTPAHELNKLLGTITGNVAFDYLADMRQNSPTGGAVGQLSDSEREAMSNIQGNIEGTNSKSTLLYNLNRLRETRVNAEARLRDAFDQDFAQVEQTLGREVEAMVSPEEITPERVERMGVRERRQLKESLTVEELMTLDDVTLNLLLQASRGEN